MMMFFEIFITFLSAIPTRAAVADYLLSEEAETSNQPTLVEGSSTNCNDPVVLSITLTPL